MVVSAEGLDPMIQNALGDGHSRLTVRNVMA
jgi:hypothetical protein